MKRQALEGAHALAVVTEWDEFKRLDYSRIFAAMQQPAFVFDGRNILDLARYLVRTPPVGQKRASGKGLAHERSRSTPPTAAAGKHFCSV